jgi:hypothetical protein
VTSCEYELYVFHLWSYILSWYIATFLNSPFLNVYAFYLMCEQPGKTGIALNMQQWQSFVEMVQEIDDAVTEYVF